MSAANEVEPKEEAAEEVPHLKVELPETVNGNGWENLHKLLETLAGHMETYIWPKDPDADIYPTLLPFLYITPDGTQDEKFLKELLYLLTIGLQGQGFGWKYKMLFDIHWNETRKGYQAELTSIRRVPSSEYPKPASEATVKE